MMMIMTPPPRLSCPTDQAGVRREHAGAVGQRAHVAVGAGAQPAPAGPLARGDPEAEAAAAHAEEPGLRRQLPGQAGVAAAGAGAAEDGAAGGGGAARRRERRHAQGDGGAVCAAHRPAEGRQGHAAGRGPPGGHGTTPQHRLGHHHRQESAAATAAERLELWERTDWERREGGNS